MSTIQIGAFSAYMAEPEGAPRGGIIVIHEIFGVNAGIRQKCDNWARAGYLAVAPDLFWRMKPGIELDSDIEADFKEAMGYFNRYGAEKGSMKSIVDIEDTIRAIRAKGVEKVGAVGYCLGGLLAYLTACRTDIDASVGYYGVMIDQLLGESHAIARPLMLHIPTADHFVGPEAQAAIHEGLDSHPKVTLHDYPGLDHAFATETGNRRHEGGARVADARTTDFFANNLR
jgi:carboxymethylenebutenolidase